MERKLTAILSADVKGYSRLMGEDEAATILTLNAYREVTDSLIHQHKGRVVGTAGDSILAEFASAVEAVQGAVEIQRELKVRNAELPESRRMEFRIGINVGDVVVDGEQIHGDGVNIAARLQALADPGGIYISGTVYDQVRNKLALEYVDLGEQTVKNIAQPVRVWRVRLEKAERPESGVRRPESEGQDPQPRRVDIAHRSSMTLAVAGLLLIGGIATILYFALPAFRNPQSTTRNQGEETSPLPLPDKPSILILPFTNMSQDPEQEYFSDGITEDLTSALSKLSGLFVISRNSASTYKGKAVKVQEVSKEMGVQYVLEGSVRKVDGQVRVTAQLIDAAQDHHLWTERYDRPLKDIFALQDEVVQKIVTTLKLQLTLWEQGYPVRKTTDNLEAYDCFLRGRESLSPTVFDVKKEANVQARQMFEKALELDPQYAEAYAGLGVSYFLEWWYGWNRAPETLERALELTQRAIALDNSLPGPHGQLGVIYLWKKQYDQAIAEAERAIALDPNDADGYVSLETILAFAGRPEEAIGLIEKAMRLNLHYPVSYLLYLSVAYREARRYDEALAPGKRFLTLNPNSVPAHYNLAVIYSELGRDEEARAVVAEWQRLAPNLSVEGFRQFLPFKDPAVLERHLAALHKAGLK
jgi:TolB-like protein/Flp pilus assembly protein TadD